MYIYSIYVRMSVCVCKCACVEKTSEFEMWQRRSL